MHHADWYFDFISPYAYLQWHRLGELRGRIEIHYRPVLLAALLDHWGQLGPAEIAPKRRFTYQHVSWLAEHMGLALRLPPAHPFNPLRLLRLAVAVDADPRVIERLFAYVWRDGCLPDDAVAWPRLLEELGLDGQAAAIETGRVKETLIDLGRWAIAAGVFGVPSLVIDDRVFWGLDATDMVLAYLDDPAPFERQDAAIAQRPAAAVRPRSRRNSP